MEVKAPEPEPKKKKGWGLGFTWGKTASTKEKPNQKVEVKQDKKMAKTVKSKTPDKRL